MPSAKLSAVSLFSGAGGLNLGVEQAGFENLASVEADPFCCETLRGHTLLPERVVEADIRTIDPCWLMEEIGLSGPGQLSLLHGGPPCQSFSQIGKRLSLLDVRGELLFEMIRFAAALLPRAILIEQVKGLLTASDRDGKRGGVHLLLVSELELLGYEVQTHIVRAVDFGVAQLRERVFVVAMKTGGCFVLPVAPSTLPRTVGDALAGLGTPALPPDMSLDSHVDITPRGDRERIRGVPAGSWLAKETNLPAEQRKNLSKKDTTKFRRLSWSQPSLTLRCGEIFFHPTDDRYLTPRECMRLHGYPDDYCLRGPIRGRSGRVRYLDQYRQIANSVPPPVAYHLACAIRDTLEEPRNRQ